MNALSKWPAEEKAKLESKKWSDRVESLQSLHGLLGSIDDLATDVSYSDLVTKLKMVGWPLLSVHFPRLSSKT